VYPIPKPTRRGFELAPGWGLAEVGVAAGGVGAGALLFLLAFPLPALPRALLAMLVAGAGIGVALPTPAGGSLWQTLQAWRAWAGGRRRWLYDWHRGGDGA
jgi:hypothetical protein